jgi:hypothetical protein
MGIFSAMKSSQSGSLVRGRPGDKAAFGTFSCKRLVYVQISFKLLMWEEFLENLGP